MSGIGHIAREREKVLRKDKTTEKDYLLYQKQELSTLARLIITHKEPSEITNKYLVMDNPYLVHIFSEDYILKLMSKPYKNRLIIAGQLLAAELDRLEYEDKVKEVKVKEVKERFNTIDDTKPVTGREIFELKLSEDWQPNNTYFKSVQLNFTEEEKKEWDSLIEKWKNEPLKFLHVENELTFPKLLEEMKQYYNVQILHERGTKENSPYISEVLEFMNVNKQYISNIPKIPNKELALFRVKLIQEELDELTEAIENNDLIEVADAFVDLQYVLSGGVLTFGLGDLFYKLFAEVQRSNMSKACNTEEEAIETVNEYRENGVETYYQYSEGKYIIYRKEDNKILKSINYSPANIKSILKQ